MKNAKTSRMCKIFKKFTPKKKTTKKCVTYVSSFLVHLPEHNVPYIFRTYTRLLKALKKIKIKRINAKKRKRNDKYYNNHMKRKMIIITFHTIDEIVISWIIVIIIVKSQLSYSQKVKYRCQTFSLTTTLLWIET